MMIKLLILIRTYQVLMGLDVGEAVILDDRDDVSVVGMLLPV